MIAAYSSALLGLNAASTSLAERAGRIIQSTTVDSTATASSSGDLSGTGAKTGPPGSGPPATDEQRDNLLVNDIVGLGLDETAFKANLAVLRSARATEERLLDIIA